MVSASLCVLGIYRRYNGTHSIMLFPIILVFNFSTLSICFIEIVDAELELSMVRHQPEGLEKLQAQTKFTRKELQSLYRGFKNVRIRFYLKDNELKQLHENGTKNGIGVCFFYY